MDNFADNVSEEIDRRKLEKLPDYLNVAGAEIVDLSSCCFVHLEGEANGSRVWCSKCKVEC